MLHLRHDTYGNIGSAFHGHCCVLCVSLHSVYLARQNKTPPVELAGIHWYERRSITLAVFCGRQGVDTDIAYILCWQRNYFVTIAYIWGKGYFSMGPDSIFPGIGDSRRLGHYQE
jgi:hypothetical protein